MNDDITVTRLDLIRQLAAERALADDLATVLETWPHWHEDAKAVLARYREARR